MKEPILQTTPEIEAIFTEDVGGNSVFSRLQAEVECNKHNPAWHQAIDPSLVHGDLRKIFNVLQTLRALRD